MLLCKHFSRSHYAGLIAIAYGNQSAEHRHHSLAASDISLKQPVHLMTALKVVTDLGDYPFLRSRSSSDDKQTCLSVQLPSGSIRDALNLVDNPALLGKKVQIRGDIVESYYGIPGLKNLTGYEVGK